MTEHAPQTLEGLKKLIHREIELRDTFHERQHSDEAKALHVAQDALSQRLEGMNEFRRQLESQTRLYVTKDYAQTMIDNILTRLEGMNEFRSQLDSQSREFVTRSENDARRAGNDQRLLTIEEKINHLEGRLWGAGAIVAMALAGLGFAVTLLT